jgi:hypothetical protein
MKHSDLPERWAQKLKAFIRDELEQERETLRAGDFDYDLKLTFEDSSTVFFRYAFHISDQDLKEIAVFTEHCGYHIFPFVGAHIEILK